MERLRAFKRELSNGSVDGFILSLGINTKSCGADKNW